MATNRMIRNLDLAVPGDETHKVIVDGLGIFGGAPLAVTQPW